MADELIDSKESKEEAEKVDRRAFLRRGVEVGGFTLLGLVGAEVLIPSIIDKVHRMTNNRGIASKIAGRLQNAGLYARANADVDVCPVGAGFICGVSDYSSCLDPATYICGQYSCNAPDTGFDCTPTAAFRCESIYACDANNNFSCTSPAFGCSAAVVCGGSGHYYYTCPTGTTYSCKKGTNYHC